MVHLHHDVWAFRPRNGFDSTPASIVDEWIALSRPLVVRRPSACDRAGLALGLPLPPSLGKARIAITVPREAIAAVAPPPALIDIHTFAPPAWRPTLDHIAALCATLDIEPRVFGSLAWERLTGLAYLTPASDLDLLFLGAGRLAVGPLICGLTEIEAKAPMRLDGEVVRADGAAANWRELQAAPPEVLVKTLHGISLQSSAEFVEGLDR
jgi:phosphoribosyl-dephospho-CoA transferase